MMSVDIPYWLIILLSTIGIIFLIINASHKEDESFRARYLLAIIPRLYFTAIYTWFWLYSPPIEIRAIWGRCGIIAILAIDLWIYFAEWIDFEWDTNWKYEWAMRKITIHNLKIKLKKKWEKFKWKIRYWKW